MIIRVQLKILLLIILLVPLSSCTNNTQEMPNDFNFSLEYGTYGKQKIDTFHNLVVKDLVENGTYEANIALTEEEKQLFYEEMMKLNIMELNLPRGTGCGVEPPSISIWNIQMNGETQSFYYKDFCDYPEEVRELLKLEDFIHNILTTKEEYKLLPEAEGYYEYKGI